MAMSQKETRATRETHDRYLANAQAAHQQGNPKLARDFLAKHNTMGAPGAGKVGANYDHLEKTYQQGAKGGSFYVTATGRKVYKSG